MDQVDDAEIIGDDRDEETVLILSAGENQVSSESKRFTHEDIADCDASNSAEYTSEEQDVKVEGEGMTCIDDQTGEQCMDGELLIASSSSSDTNLKFRMYLDVNNDSQVIFYNTADPNCPTDNTEEHISQESDKTPITISCKHSDEDCEKKSTNKNPSKSNSGEKPFICPVEGCGRNFTSSGHLKYHQSTHSGEKPFKCQHPGCDRVFAWPAHLKYHLKTHTGDRPFKCDIEGCGKTFYVLQRLNVHLRVHTGERPYTCEVENCMKSFTTAGNLKNHMRIHTGERPYVCPFVTCGRSFTEHSSLRKHKLRHTGEKPYVCEICGKSFSQSGSRNAHEKRHALERPPRFKGEVSLDNLSKDVEQNQEELMDSGEDQEQNIVYSPDMDCKTSDADHIAGLAQPIVAKEVSIETTPVHSLQEVVQNVAEELISHQQNVLPESGVSVVTLAETVVAQRALLQSMLDIATVIPVTQAGSSDELTVEHVLQHQDVEQIMQSVVNQHILSGQIQLPISGDEVTVTSNQETLTVEVPSFMTHSDHSQPILLTQHDIL